MTAWLLNEKAAPKKDMKKTPTSVKSFNDGIESESSVRLDQKKKVNRMMRVVKNQAKASLNLF